tara:strand:+ start:1349 stop:1744 length:396 start_codon:yes stop_codon:yes gene_type:complete
LKRRSLSYCVAEDCRGNRPGRWKKVFPGLEIMMLNRRKTLTDSDIDTDSLYEFLETADSTRNLNESLLLQPDVVLQKLDLMTEDKLTKAAVLLFGKKPEDFSVNTSRSNVASFHMKQSTMKWQTKRSSDKI